MFDVLQIDRVRPLLVAAAYMVVALLWPPLRPGNFNPSRPRPFFWFNRGRFRLRESPLMSVQPVPPGLDGGITVGVAAALTEVLANLRGKLADPDGARDGLFEGLEPAVLRRADLLVAKLLSFAGRQELKPTRVEVLPFLCSFADLLRHALDFHIDVMVHVDRECLAWRVDRAALEEALMQLVMNWQHTLQSRRHMAGPRGQGSMRHLNNWPLVVS